MKDAKYLQFSVSGGFDRYDLSTIDAPKENESEERWLTRLGYRELANFSFGRAAVAYESLDWTKQPRYLFHVRALLNVYVYVHSLESAFALQIQLAPLITGLMLEDEIARYREGGPPRGWSDKP